MTARRIKPLSAEPTVTRIPLPVWEVTSREQEHESLLRYRIKAPFTTMGRGSAKRRLPYPDWTLCDQDGVTFIYSEEIAKVVGYSATGVPRFSPFMPGMIPLEGVIDCLLAEVAVL